MDLASKYRPSTFEDMTEQDIVVDILNNMCSKKDIKNRNFLFIGPAGTGKAQPLTSKVLTPSGYKLMGDIHEGDEVITSNDNIGIVSDVYPQGMRDVYEITCYDGSTFKVADNHLNCVHTYDDSIRKDHVIDTLELKNMIDKDRDVFIDSVDINSWNYEKKVPFSDAYLYGVFLNGLYYRKDKWSYESDYDRLLVDIDYRIELEYEYNKQDHIEHIYLSNDQSCYPGDLLKDMQSVFGKTSKYNRHIDTAYLINSRRIRQGVLQGIIDSIGQIDSQGITIVVYNKDMSDDLAFLVRSLGIADYVVIDKDDSTSKDNLKTSPAVYIHTLLYYDTKYRTVNIHEKTTGTQITFEHNRQIKSICLQPKEKCQCIMIDHPDHTYITDDLIPTHNTTLARILNKTLNGAEVEPVEIDAASYSSVNDIRQIVTEMKSYPLQGDYKVFIIDEAHALSSQAWQALLKVLEEPPAKTITCLCTTNPEKIPDTIISRVQTFRLAKISLSGISNRLKHILTSEGYTEGEGNNTFTLEAIEYIAKLANGGMRDSITLLSKVLVYTNEVNIEAVVSALNLPDYDEFFDLLNSLVKRSNTDIIKIIDKVYNSGVNFVEWFSNFHSFLCNIVKYICVKDISKTMIPSTYEDRIIKYEDAHLQICLSLSKNILNTIKELKTTNYLQETAITYLCSCK